MDLDDIIRAARTAAHLEGIGDPYGASISNYQIEGGEVDRNALRRADQQAEQDNMDAWETVVKAVLQAAAR